MPQNETTIDLREMSCQQRHGLVLQCLAALEPGFALIIVNDHNPEPLRQQLAARFGDRIGWRLTETGPNKFEVRIHLLDTRT